jgi:hypothetical protein
MKFFSLCLLWLHYWWYWPFHLILWLGLSSNIIHCFNLRWIFHHILYCLLPFENFNLKIFIFINWIIAFYVTFCLLSTYGFALGDWLDDIKSCLAFCNVSLNFVGLCCFVANCFIRTIMCFTMKWMKPQKLPHECVVNPTLL